MKQLAGFILSGYGQAAFSVAGFAWFASFVPLVGLFSSAALALVALKWGGQRAGFVLVLSTMLLLGFFAVASLVGLRLVNYQLVFLLVFLQWLPLIGIAYLLRRTTSLSFTLNMVVIVSFVVLLLVTLLVPERTELWDRFFSTFMQESLSGLNSGAFDLNEEYRSFLEVMTGIALTSLVSIWTASLLLARWWEKLLDAPGSFRAEFTRLNLGKVMAVSGIILFVGVSVMESPLPLLRELFMVIAYFMFMQGIATVHYLLSTLSNPGAWLFAFYATLVLSPVIPQVPSAVGALGTLENFFRFRSRRPLKK